MSTDLKKPTAAPKATAASGPQGLLMAGVVVTLAALAFIIFLVATGRGAVPIQSANAANEAAPVLPEPAAPAPPATPPGPPAQMPNRGQLLPSGLRIETIRAGTGRAVTRADVPLVRYELRVLGRGGVIESNFNDPQPVPMSLNGVVPGFAEALTHIRVGGESRFWVPPNLGYGPEQRPGAPFGPNDILEFRVRIDGIAQPARNSPNPTNSATEAPTPAQ